MAKLLVLGEIRDNSIRNVSFEAIAAAKTASNGGEVVGVILGSSVEHLAGGMFAAGADKVVVVEHSNLGEYTSDGYSQALLKVLEDESAEGIFFGHTAIGKDLAPKLAARKESGLLSDVIAVDYAGDNAVFTRPIYSGKAFEKKIVTNGLMFATIRPNNISPLEKDESRSGEVVKVEMDITNLRQIVKEVIRKATDGVDLSEAKVIIAGGRGCKSVEGFAQLKEIATMLNGAVGASRGACDAEYCDYSIQIGQTGKVVTPDLYIAVGLSGAIQHIAGMSNSKVIVAINKDPEANIFSIADYGIVGDLFEVLPLLKEELKGLLQNA
jgi:electron transfer flavoprotein alpha subunit